MLRDKTDQGAGIVSLSDAFTVFASGLLERQKRLGDVMNLRIFHQA